MKGPAQEIESFRVFADSRLQNHIQELETRYQNREPDASLKTEAYRKHQQIFQKELLEKIHELTTKHNEFLRPALVQVKDKFLSKLNENTI